jgi:replicative DNA helicase
MRDYAMTNFSGYELAAPYSEEAENAVLGAVLLNNDAYMGIAAFLKPTDFFLKRSELIWSAIQRIAERGDAIDLVTVSEELRSLRQLEIVGGTGFLFDLVSSAPTSVNAEVYARLVERAALRRNLMEAADQIKRLATDETLETDTVTAQAEKALFSVTERNLRRDVVTLREVLGEFYERVEARMNNPDIQIGLPTGFRDLDLLMGGLQRSDLLIFAGRPGMGKTSFLLSVALNAAKFGSKVAIFSMEMGAEQIVQRLVSMETGIDMQFLRLGALSPAQWELFVQATGRMSEMHIFIDDTPAMNPISMRAKCRRLLHEHRIDLVIVDYIQLMNAGTSFQNNRVQELSYISRMMKEMARELNVPVLTAAQLSRAVEQRHDKRPLMSDLRESGSLEQDADIVMFLYRDAVYNEASETPNQADIIIAKHRNGPTGTVSLYFENRLTKFTDARVDNFNLSGL